MASGAWRFEEEEKEGEEEEEEEEGEEEDKGSRAKQYYSRKGNLGPIATKWSRESRLEKKTENFY